MNKTITLTGPLEQFNAELQVQENEEKKDNCVLLTLVIAGIIGVYTLINFGSNDVKMDSATQSVANVGEGIPQPTENTTLMGL